MIELNEMIELSERDSDPSSRVITLTMKRDKNGNTPFSSYQVLAGELAKLDPSSESDLVELRLTEATAAKLAYQLLKMVAENNS